MICIDIDELTPCLVDATTGETIETEVIRIKRRSFLAKFTEKNGWYTNWQDLAKTNEIYALVVKGSVDIQGLIAIEDNPDFGAVYISWAVAAPKNNPELYDAKKYNGVGGHLLAIAIERSENMGHHGDVTGFCRNKEIMEHFVKAYDADPICILHPYQIGLYGQAAKKSGRYMTMNGQMTKYEKYLATLADMKEPKPANLIFDMRSAVEYAESKGVRISELSQSEKDRFIKQKPAAKLA